MKECGAHTTANIDKVTRFEKRNSVGIDNRQWEWYHFHRETAYRGFEPRGSQDEGGKDKGGKGGKEKGGKEKGGKGGKQKGGKERGGKSSWW